MLALRSLLVGLRGFPGAVRLAALRVLALVVCLAPARLLADQKMQKWLSGLPTDEGPLSFEVLIGLLSEAGGAFVGAVAAGAVVFFLVDQLLTAAAIHLAGSGGPARVWAAMWTTGWDYLLRLVRIVVAAALVHVVILVAAGQIADLLDQVGERSGWTGLTRVVVVPSALAGGVGILLACIGAWALFARVLVVADGRQNIIRALLDAARALLRVPSLALVFAGVTVGFHLLNGVLVVALGWPPEDGGGTVVLSLLLLLPQSWLWISFVGAFRHAYADGPFEHVASTVDAPLPLLGWLTRRFG